MTPKLNFYPDFFHKTLVAMNQQVPRWQLGMRGLNLSTKHQVGENISDILFDYKIRCIFQICSETKLNDHYYSENGLFVLATLHNSLAIFASNHEVVLYLVMRLCHGNNGAQQIAEPLPLC